MPKLFDIGADLLALSDLLDEVGGEVTQEQVSAAIEAWFAEITDNESEKLEGYIGLIKVRESEATVAKAEKEQFAAKQQARENDVRRLKDRLKLYLEMTGRKKVETAAGRTISVQANGGVIPLELDEVEHTKIDPRFLQVQTFIDKEAVRDALTRGEPIPFARLGQRGTQLRIR